MEQQTLQSAPEPQPQQTNPTTTTHQNTSDPAEKPRRRRKAKPTDGMRITHGNIVVDFK